MTSPIAQSTGTGSGRPRWPPIGHAVLAILALAALYVAARYAMLIADGGHYWATGDWLIHWRAGPVRRGLAGTVILALADLTGLGLLTVAAILQTAIWLALVGTVLACLRAVPASGPLLMLALSPLFLMMPVYYLKLAMAKEIIGCLGIALIAATAPARSRVPFLAGCILLAAAGFAHESNGFLAPAGLVLTLVLHGAGLLSRGTAVAGAGLVVTGSAAALLFSVAFRGFGLHAPICAELARYGDMSLFCDPANESPIWWLERTTADGIAFMWRWNIASGAWPMFAGGYALAMVPFFFFRLKGDSGGRRTRLALLAATAGILVMAPLFVVATDWGRWFQMHVFTLTMLTVTGLKLGLVEPRTVSLNPLFPLYSLVWSVPDYPGADFTFGMIDKLGRALGRFP